MVLSNLNGDARTSVRLIRAIKDLYAHTKKDNTKYWQTLERSLRGELGYIAFCKFIGHLGVRGRLLRWAGFCDARCFACRADLFGICCNTFAVGRKFCSGCKTKRMVCEMELSRRIPITWIAPMRTSLRHSWISAAVGGMRCYYLRADVNRYLQGYPLRIAV